MRKLRIALLLTMLTVVFLILLLNNTKDNKQNYEHHKANQIELSQVDIPITINYSNRLFLDDVHQTDIEVISNNDEIAFYTISAEEGYLTSSNKKYFKKIKANMNTDDYISYSLFKDKASFIPFEIDTIQLNFYNAHHELMNSYTIIVSPLNDNSNIYLAVELTSESIEDLIPIIDENAKEILEKEYRITNIDRELVYIKDSTLYLNFYFNTQVSRNEILAIRSLVLSKYIIEPNVLTHMLPYGNAFACGIDLQNIDLKIYIDDSMIVQENFTDIERSLTIDYFEDLDVELDQRAIENNELTIFSQRIKHDFQAIKKVDFSVPYKGNVLCIKIRSKGKLSNEKIDIIKELIEQDLVRKVDFLGIVLQLYDDDDIYIEEGLHNSNSNRYWFDDYWGNHQFFDYNINQ